MTSSDEVGGAGAGTEQNLINSAWNLLSPMQSPKQGTQEIEGYG